MDNYNNFYKELDTSYTPPARGHWEPNLKGTGLAPDHIQATNAHYFTIGEMVFVYAYYLLTEVTDFGTGDYSITLPFTAAYHADLFGGAIHDTSTTKNYTVRGHIEKDSKECGLFWISGVAQDKPVSHNEPINFTTADVIHISGWYERRMR
jgi:hypothetical protein